MVRYTLWLSLILVLLQPQVVFGQNGSIRGNVHSQETGEPLFMCTVTMTGTNIGQVTDENGYFHFSKLNAAYITLIFSSVGYISDTVHLDLVAGEIRTLKITLRKRVKEIGEVVVNASKSLRQSQVRVSLQQITPKDLSQIPQIGAEPDLAQYLQSLPGFVHSGEQGGQLYIRGGSEVQNSFLLDGIPIYNPFHSLSLFSVIDSDILQSVSVYSGGFGSDLGGRISSVMDSKTRDGNLRKIAGKASISTMGMSGEIEGPLAHTGFLQNTSFLFSAKTGLLSRTAPVLYPYTGNSGTPYGFTDLFGKLTRSGENGNKISFTGFRFTDQVGLDSSLSYNWENYGAGCNVVIIPDRSNGLIRAALNYSSYHMNWLDGMEGNSRFSSISSFRVLIESVNFLGPNELKIGMETNALNSQLDFQNLYGFVLEEDIHTTDLAVYVKNKWQKGILVLETGIRGAFYATSGVMIPEPRVGLKINVNSRFRLKTAAGFYSQNLVSVRSDQDVVNFFTGFILEPQNTTRNFGNRQWAYGLQTAWHTVMGIETEPSDAIQLNCEFYAKYFPRTISYNRNKRFSSNTLHSTVPDLYTASFIIERGWAYGAEMQVKYSSERFNSQISYSLSRVRLYNGLEKYSPHYDRRHSINLIACYNLGNLKNPWQLNAHFSLGSGFPYTPVTSYFGKADLGNYVTDAVLKDYYAYGVIFGETNSARLPIFHRLDLTIKHSFHLKKARLLETSFSVYNAYNWKNIFYFDLAKFSVRYQLPILPVIGLKYSF